MMKTILFFLSSTLFLSACRNDTTNQQNGDETTTTTTSTAIAPENVKLICEAVDEPNMQADAPQHEVFLQLGDSKIKIADILNCETLTPDLYGQHQIPANALSAVGGWWAGAGDYFYVVQEGENFVVKQGSMDEEMESNDYGYKTVVTYSREGKEVF